MRLSVVIPTLNEAQALGATLAQARLACPDAEIIVADGGSRDATRTIAREHGVRVLETARGRGHQQNMGARAARGDVLLFLHADTLLPPGAQNAVTGAFTDPCAQNAVVGGNFRLRFDPPNRLNRVFACVYNLRARHARHYYGDSCLWIRRDVFTALGGFREGMLMEDWEFVRRLEARCRATGRERTVWLPLVVATSARRFSGRRWRYLYLWTKLHYLHARGVSGDALAALYPDAR